MKRKARTRKNRSPNARLIRAISPKAGPGDFYVQEFVSARTGREVRYRNIGEHALTLAHARGKISDEQFAAGEEFRRLWEFRSLSGRDSTELIPGVGARSDLPFTQTQHDAIRRLGRIRERLKRRDWTIVEKFCGEGWPMVEAVRAATICHPSGVVQRVHEAMDELIEACGWRRSERTSA